MGMDLATGGHSHGASLWFRTNTTLLAHNVDEETGLLDYSAILE